MKPRSFVLLLLVLFQIVKLATAATKEDIKNVFSLVKKNVAPGDSCPEIVRHDMYQSSGPGGGYVRIPHKSISVDTSQCRAEGENPFTPLLDWSTFEAQFKRHSNLFPIATNDDLGLLGLLRRARSVIGIIRNGDLRCGKHTFRKGTMVAIVRNNTASLAELGLFDLINNATYLLMFETKVAKPKRCVYRTKVLSTAAGRPIPDCFPAQVTLNVAGRSVRMDQLSHGDVVHTHAGESSQVFGFSHRDYASMGRYLQFSTESGRALIVSKGHYVFSEGLMKPAHFVRVGDMLDTGTGSTRVTMVERSVLARGRFNPHTMSGQLMVNGFRVSCYTQELHPTIAHRLLSPIRLLWRFTGGWGDRSSPLRWLHGETKIRSLTRFIPRGPSQLKWLAR